MVMALILACSWHRHIRSDWDCCSILDLTLLAKSVCGRGQALRYRREPELRCWEATRRRTGRAVSWVPAISVVRTREPMKSPWLCTASKLEADSQVSRDKPIRDQGRGCAIVRWREVKEGKGRSPSIRCCRALTLMASASDWASCKRPEHGVRGAWASSILSGSSTCSRTASRAF